MCLPGGEVSGSLLLMLVECPAVHAQELVKCPFSQRAELRAVFQVEGALTRGVGGR